MWQMQIPKSVASINVNIFNGCTTGNGTVTVMVVCTDGKYTVGKGF